MAMHEGDVERICRQGTQAWLRLKKDKNWTDWLAVGEAHAIGREWAMRMAGTNQPQGKAYNTTFGEWLAKYKFDDMDKGDRSRLFEVMDNLPAIEEWRRTLPRNLRLKLNHPNAVLRKWKAQMAPEPRTEDGKPKPTLRDSVANLSEEVTAKDREIAQLKDHIAELEAAREATTPATDDDDTANEEVANLRRQLSAAQARIGTDLLRNRDFQSKLKRHLERLAEQGGKHRATMSVVVVAAETMWLERLLVDYGIWTGSVKRKTDPKWRERTSADPPRGVELATDDEATEPEPDKAEAGEKPADLQYIGNAEWGFVAAVPSRYSNQAYCIERVVGESNLANHGDGYWVHYTDMAKQELAAFLDQPSKRTLRHLIGNCCHDTNRITRQGPVALAAAKAACEADYAVRNSP
jgi:hypothetical protein